MRSAGTPFSETPVPCMDESRDAATLADLIEACERIVTYTRGVEEHAFNRDSQLYDAVIRQVSILGEAVKRLSTGFTKSPSGCAVAEYCGNARSSHS
jgi:Protein of unknown function DUF86